MSNCINSKNEFLWLYKLQKERVEKLREAELKSGGNPLPDTTYNIDLLLKILVQIADKSLEERSLTLKDHYVRLLEDLEAEENPDASSLKKEEVSKSLEDHEDREKDRMGDANNE